MVVRYSGSIAPRAWQAHLMVNVRKYPDRKIVVLVFSQNSLDDDNTLIYRY